MTVGLCPPEAARAITTAAADRSRFDVAALGAGGAATGTPVIALVAALREAAGDEAAPHVHLGATSQDIVDSAAMLVARRALVPVLADARAISDDCARLAAEHRGTLMAGRTLLQQALPTTFGLRAAGWMTGVDESRRALGWIADHDLAVSLGGAVGTLAAYGDRGPEVVRALAVELDLAVPTIPWHTDRRRIGGLAGTLGMLSGGLSKIARDVTVLASSEVGELREGGGLGRGSSTAMPNKRNPVGAAMATACGVRVPGLVATLLAAMAQPLERAAGEWQAEAATLSDLLAIVGSQAAWVADVVSELEVDARRMADNLDAAGDLLMAESAVTALAAELGRVRAREIVDDAVAATRADGGSLHDALFADPRASDAVGADGIAAALRPADYLGATDALIDAALAAHDEAGR